MYQDRLTEILRKLAKSSYYQTLFSFSKESTVSIFINDRNFTRLQVQFLSYLSFYHTIETDIYMGDIDERVLEDYIYEDAYYIYKNEERKKQKKPTLSSALSKTNPTGKSESFRWNFVKRRKR